MTMSYFSTLNSLYNLLVITHKKNRKGSFNFPQLEMILRRVDAEAPIIS